jgi:hypothetical protein
MSVNVNTTEEGLRLLAQATAANPIVYTGAVGNTTFYQYKSQLRNLKKSSFTSEADGEIFSCSATGDTIRVSALFRRAKSASVPLTIGTVLICGKLQSQDDSQAVGVLAWASTSGFRVPASHVTPDTGTIIPVNLTLSDANEVTVQAGDTPSIGDLDRFVSCYKAGNINDGENQSIRGNKTFYNSCSFNNIYFDGEFLADADILFNDEYNVGSEEQPIGTLYARAIGSTEQHVKSIVADAIFGVIPYPTSSETEELNVPIGGFVVIYGVVALTGRTFTVTANSVHDGTMTGGQGTQFITAGTYVALSSNASTSGCLLAMRIA